MRHIHTYEAADIGLSGTGQTVEGYGNALRVCGFDRLVMAILMEITYAGITGTGVMRARCLGVPDCRNKVDAVALMLANKYSNWNVAVTDQPTCLEGTDPADGVWRGVFIMPTAASGGGGDLIPCPFGYIHTRLTTPSGGFDNVGSMALSKLVLYG